MEFSLNYYRTLLKAKERKEEYISSVRNSYRLCLVQNSDSGKLQSRLATRGFFETRSPLSQHLKLFRRDDRHDEN